MTRVGCCARLHLREDNARFFLLAVVMTVYMLLGATLFMFLEQDKEITDRNHYRHEKETFIQNNPTVNLTELENFLNLHADASAAGLLEGKRDRWDFPGAFYFVGTVVSTIGFGMTTPRTTPGKISLICYGFLGCAGGILFFNLFLERIITFLAYLLRAVHVYVEERDMRRKGLVSTVRRGSDGSEDDSLDSWKPSVYWVMLILFLGAVVIACCASAMYHPVENWSYFDSIYFCFVAFATIGFGDLVVSQNDEYDYEHIYRFGNFLFLVVGCCCIYSLFNVTSIVIKQVLNWIIRKLDFDCCYKPKPRGRRNAITPGHMRNGGKSGGQAPDLTDVDSNYDSEGSRRGSNDMISMKDFLQCKGPSLMMMQKQLQETAQRGLMASRSHEHHGGGFQGGVGPLAIVSKTLGQDDA